jgi:hypothetical protein
VAVGGDELFSGTVPNAQLTHTVSDRTSMIVCENPENFKLPANREFPRTKKPTKATEA